MTSPSGRSSSFFPELEGAAGRKDSPPVYVQVAVPVFATSGPDTYCYRVRGKAPAPGARVAVPFAGQKLVGWVAGPGTPPKGVKILAIRKVLEAEPDLPEELLELARWIGEYYTVPLGIALRAMLPKTLFGAGAAKARRVVLFARAAAPPGTLAELAQRLGRAPKQKALYERLLAGGEESVAALAKRGYSRAVVHALAKKGLIEVRRGEGGADPYRGIEDDGPDWTPTSDQQRCIRAMERAARGSGGTLLLHGVTGSGKTLVYIELLKRIDAGKRGAIILVPEIALTPQTVGRFRRAFGDQVAVLHSKLSGAERLEAWRLIRSGEKKIVIGPRSAIFAPLARPAAIIVDEEHESTYKQYSPAPRYNARDLAVVRASMLKIPCILGSATPSLESWANAKRGKYALLSLPKRVGRAAMPRIEIVDLGRENKAAPAAGRARSSESQGPRHQWILSRRLQRAIEDRLERDEQTLLLLNRRGYAGFSLCEDCGDTLQCSRCSVTMTYHRTEGRMVCHHCGGSCPVPSSCSSCGSAAVRFRGVGTQQLERVLLERFPDARIARMDQDTTRSRWSHQEILARVGAGEVDILLGTQMIAKGLDFHRVTLAAVIYADMGLHLPDFRSSERTFQLLSQLSGRAGRGATPGEVVIQSRLPNHDVLTRVLNHDYAGFADEELERRQSPVFPPWTRLARVLLRAGRAEHAMEEAIRLARWLPRAVARGAEVLGPAPAPIERIQDEYRWHLLLRGSAASVGRSLAAISKGFVPTPSSVRVSLDRDPQQML